MNLQQTPRIVSKSHHLRFLIRKAGLFSSGVLRVCLGAMGASLCVGILIFSLSFYQHVNSREPVWFLLLTVGFWVFLGELCVWMARSGVVQLEKIERLERLVPLTRQIANQLPAEQSLVRASSEPAEQQQAVLLRVAGSDTQTPAHELLRATTQEEKP